jgi:hypothetical protein
VAGGTLAVLVTWLCAPGARAQPQLHAGIETSAGYREQAQPSPGRKPRRLPVSPSATGLCTEPLAGVAAPDAPHGVFVLQFPGNDLAPVTNYILHQPDVCGGDIFVVWSTVDQGGGHYNWSSVDNQITPWAQAGKKVNLIVWAVSDSATNTGTPNYVLNAPGYQSVSCPNRGTTASYPVYYTDVYKGYLKTFMQAVINRYGANSNVGYIRFGLSRGGEVFPTCLQQMETFSGFSTLAQFDTQWESYITEMTAFQKGLLSQIPNASSGHVVQLMAALDEFGSPAQNSVTDFEAKNAVSLGFGFGSQGLELSDYNAYHSGKPCGSDWCAMFKAYAGQVPLELQSVAASDPTNAAGGTGSMTVLLPFALSLHTQIFEVYIQDLQVAYDPTSKYYSQYGDAYRKAFDQVAQTVGFGSAK